MTHDPKFEIFTRRQTLSASVAAAAALMLPEPVRKALAATPHAPPALGDIKHVVLLMQENRSFDHYFGTMKGVRGFADPDAMTLSTGQSVFHQPSDRHAIGYVKPFRLDCNAKAGQQMPSTGHDWEVLHDAWNEGRMDAWMSAHYRLDGNKSNVPFAMGYFEEADVPFHRALAKSFTICDRYHCSMLGGTAPNRLYWETASIDPEGVASGPILGNEGTVRTWRTYAENLTEAGVSWRCYHVPDGMESSLKYFKAFREAPHNSPLRRNIAYGAIDAFDQDAINDRLPAVSWLFAPRSQNEHPNQSTPAAGARFIADKIAALAANPEVWAKTVFILNYDENDGLFDHVPPPVPPAGTPGEFVDKTSPTGIKGGSRPIGAGFRVPCIVVSPWTTGGWICSEPFDHTSILQFLEKVTGVEAPNITAWRRRTFGDMTSIFRFDKVPAQPPQVESGIGALGKARRTVDHTPLPDPGSRRILPAEAKPREI